MAGPAIDIFVVDNAGDSVVEMPGEGSDTVRAFIGDMFGQSRLSSDGNRQSERPERGRTICIIGNAGNNMIDGGDGNDMITGGGGIDLLPGGRRHRPVFAQGGDTVFGEDENDGISIAQTAPLASGPSDGGAGTRRWL